VRRPERRPEGTSSEEPGGRHHRAMMVVMEPPEQHGRTAHNRGHQPPVRHIATILVMRGRKIPMRGSVGLLRCHPSMHAAARYGSGR